MILVTGAAGYMGSALVHALSRKKKPVRAVDNFTTGTLRKVNDSPVWEKDFTSLTDVKEMVQGVTTIVHLGAISDITQCQNHPKEALLTNVLSVKYLIDEGVNAGVQKIIFPSSFAVYDPDSTTITEETTIQPQNYYGQMKWWAEELLKAEQRKGTLDTIIFRQSNICGKGLVSKRTVLEAFCRSLLENREIRIHGSGKQVRNFIHLEDAIEAYLQAIDTPVTGVWNLAGEETYSIRQLAQLVNQVGEERLGRTVRVITDPNAQTGHEREPQDITCDLHRLKELLNHRPMWTVKETIHQLLNQKQTR
ncbi:NAD-dependent epimerase/dehydratase family protein [Melghirimyces algeriensis]|uniref:UDP-glucose 4-epimerase n=1 Tax=Melghirimyces algeriensis TaxID=910412 RepID=A0A521ADM1_9BACL|nr:NAD(P)-dependent oxidoreductase [Melghirimyces algeriensis]SMO32866.1 UDP-glucose 4-epimerase [Melghirimyces algeriensis]